MEEADSLEYKRSILEYWTLVEFFSPYILENVLNHRLIYQKIYEDVPPSEPLPWLEAPTIEENDPATPFAKGYYLYLGLFNVEETADRARHTFAGQPSYWQSINWKNCGVSSSTTCFARLTVTTHGIPLFGTLTLSTLPWAHGRLLNGNHKSVTIEQFWKSVNRLLISLREEFSVLLPQKLMKRKKTQAHYLDRDSLIQLTEYLFDWAGYKPQGYPIVLIESLSGDHTIAAKEPQIKSERDVPILNSFYIQDLESAAISLKSQQGKPIDHYLSGHKEERILLNSEEGVKTILNMIRPEKIPFGRWPDPLDQQQSLMQQFAINATFDRLKTKDIFSVNGPPGTGKTSLLREIIAENIVARADALSKFNRAKDAFIGRQALNFDSSDPIYVSELEPSLLGYEMLVVSSNNTAVQNLSQELPLRSQLDSSFQYASYLESVATKVLGLKKNEAWGLVSATLGNLENCRHFVENVFMLRNEVEGHSRIWDWIEEYQGPSFSSAREAFILIKEKVEPLFEQLEYFAFLHEEMKSHTVETYCAKEFQEFNKAVDEAESLNSHLSKLLQDESEAKEFLKLLQARENLWKQEKPSILARIMNQKGFEEWSEKFNIFRKEHLAAIEELQRCKMELKELRNLILKQNEIENDKGEKLLDRGILFHLYQDAYRELKQIYSDVRLPHHHLDEKESHFQTYYLTKEINALRSELFVAAMTLHEAWLAETSRIKGGFRGNLMAIANLLQGKTPTTAEDTRLAWQSVFILIPVISSTFASIGRLFRYLEPGSLGWLLIDEAGQAVPQAAVGAIWRAKRVLSIGDPFQIEPICTVPSEVIDGMAKMNIQDHTLSWAPSQISVQNLMDRASVFGSKRTIQDESYWLGSPLRVHRRCLEPMFTIANTIAYEKSMLFATGLFESTLSPSCWWDIGGHTTNKQYVPDQGNALKGLLMDSLAKLDEPDLYVISPFREIISQIHQLLLDDKALGELFKQKFPNIQFHHWLCQAVGTVHTFQGKQASAVYFVLGGDKSTFGAIEWASRKPNLLNVAVTRAQSRFYVIGDYDLWKNWPYFEVAAKHLKRCIYKKNNN